MGLAKSCRHAYLELFCMCCINFCSTPDKHDLAMHADASSWWYVTNWPYAGATSRKPISIYYIPVFMHRELASLHCCVAYSKASIVWPDINAAVRYACVQLKSDWLFDRWWQTMPCWQHRQWQTPRKPPGRPAAYCVLPMSWRTYTTAICKPGVVSLCIDCWLHLCIAHLVGRFKHI